MFGECQMMEPSIDNKHLNNSDSNTIFSLRKDVVGKKDGGSRWIKQKKLCKR